MRDCIGQGVITKATGSIIAGLVGDRDLVLRAAYVVCRQRNSAQLLAVLLKASAEKQLTASGLKEHRAQEELVEVVQLLADESVIPGEDMIRLFDHIVHKSAPIVKAYEEYVVHERRDVLMRDIVQLAQFGKLEVNGGGFTAGGAGGGADGQDGGAVDEDDYTKDDDDDGTTTSTTMTITKMTTKTTNRGARRSLKRLVGSGEPGYGGFRRPHHHSAVGHGGGAGRLLRRRERGGASARPGQRRGNGQSGGEHVRGGPLLARRRLGALRPGEAGSPGDPRGLRPLDRRGRREGRGRRDGERRVRSGRRSCA